MITIGYSTRKSNPEFYEYLKLSSGLKDVQVIEKINNGEKSLSKVYNEILDESINDIVVLCHDDIYFDTKKWGEKLLKHFKNTEYGILGVAGSTYLPKSGMWWENTSKMVGIVNHEHNGKKWESKYSQDLSSEIKKTVITDGLFISLSKSKIKVRFDETVDGFHFYDVNFSFQNYLENVLVGVMFNIRITHKSIGQTNQQWENNRVIFSNRFESLLPQEVKLTKEDKLKIILISDDTDKTYDYLTPFLGKNTIDVVSNNIEKSTKKKLLNNKIKIYPKKEIPNLRLGDGKSLIKKNDRVIRTEKNVYYKQKDMDYDVFMTESVSLFNQFKSFFPNAAKILLNSENNFYGHDLNTFIFDGNPESTYDFIIEEFNKKNNKINVKIVSGYSAEGGSTTILINLTNMFNENGIETIFYGPHNYHLDKCRSDSIENLKLNKDDILLTHFYRFEKRPNVKNVVLACHEKWWFEVADIPKYWDMLVFSHEEHRKYHSRYNGPYTTIPNPKEPLVPIDKPELDLVAGVIGTVEERKQTHKSIERALEDGCTKILIYGKVPITDYFDKYVKKYLNHPYVKFMDFTNSKQEMYNSVGRVYHSSIGEVACLVKDECHMTNTQFFGNEETTHEVSKLTNQEILELWKQTLMI